MLTRLNPIVTMYLDRAERAHARARRATTAADREFHQLMEASWMNLAASSAFAERVELFLHARRARAAPRDAAARHGAMANETLDAGRCVADRVRAFPPVRRKPPNA